MVSAFLSVAVAAFIAGAVAAATMLATRRLWSGRAYLSLAFGVTGVSAASYLSFLAFWLNPIFGRVASIGLILACLVYLVVSRVWTHWRPALPLVLLTIGILFFYLALLYLWQANSQGFSLAEVRFSKGSLPPDNAIPTFFSERLSAGVSTHGLLGDWNGSDRPPLQAGFILLATAATSHFTSIAAGGFGASVVAQILWVPSVFAFVRALGFTRVHATFGVLISAAVGTTLLNTIYTWPKLMSAALILCAGAFLLDAAKNRSAFGRSFVIAIVLFVLAVLAHGVAAFTWPFLVALGFYAYRGISRRQILGWTGISLAAGIVTYIPWMLYQRFADPPGDRLLKWHIAGVIAPDGRSFGQALIDSYSKLTVPEWWAAKLANLRAVFNPNPLSGIQCLCGSDIDSRRNAEFFTTTTAIGLAGPLIVLVAIAIVVQIVRFRRVTSDDKKFLFLVGAAAASILFWCLVMFIPGSTIVHQGSQVWIFLLLIAPVVWLSARNRILATVVVAAQFVVTLAYFVPFDGATDLRPGAIVAGSVALAVCAVGVWLLMSERPLVLQRSRDANSVAPQPKPSK